jgi:hypothetical protein
VYGVKPFDETKSLMGYGLGIDESWFPIIHKLSEDISKIVKRDNLTNFRVIQVKSKFGSLRYYTENSSTEIQDLIYLAEIACDNVGKK